MSVNSHYVRNAQNIFQKVNSTVGRIKKQQGGEGRSVTQKGMDIVSNLNMGRGYSPAVSYSHCNDTSPPRPGNQVGGVSYGFTKSGAALSGSLKGSYPVPTKMEKSKQCGGDRSDCAYKQPAHGKLGGRKRKSRRKKTRTRKSKGRKRRKRRKSRKRNSRKRKTRRKKSKKRKRKRKTRRRRKTLKGGRINYSSPNPGPMPWATGPGSFERQSSPPFATYNHYLRK